MKYSSAFLISCFLVLTIFGACKHQPEEVLVIPNGNGNGGGNAPLPFPCDSNIVYFNTDILPIINSNCAMSGCHDPATAKEGVVLNNYANIMTTGKVVPFSPGSSKIYKEITTTSAKDIMPPAPRPKLSPAEIALIAKWINQGAKDTTCTAGNCDSTNFKYATAVSKTINTFCVGCHGSINPSAGISLNTFAGVQAVAANGKLLGSIKQLAGFKPMPVGSKLDDCRIKQIQKWVEAGFPNN